ncbi:translation elongation factor Ts [bacterium]|nr:translation elongation factor Ts [bacterium]
MSITAEDVKKLRDMSGAGMMDAKRALEEANGDQEKAMELLRKKGIASAAKKADRATENGLVGSYVHGGKIGVLVEVACETDFVARTEDFQDFVRDLCMHVAAANPEYLNPEDVPADVVEKEKAVYKEEVIASGKPAEHADKIVEGKLNKFYEGICLNKQAFVKDPATSIEELTKSMIAKVGENIIVKRFVRMELGQSDEV